MHQLLKSCLKGWPWNMVVISETGVGGLDQFGMKKVGVEPPARLVKGWQSGQEPSISAAKFTHSISISSSCTRSSSSCSSENHLLQKKAPFGDKMVQWNWKLIFERNFRGGNWKWYKINWTQKRRTSSAIRKFLYNFYFYTILSTPELPPHTQKE